MIYFKYVRMQLRSILEHRLSMILVIISQFFVSFFALLSIVVLFDRFGQIDGWSLGEVALCYSVTWIAYGITECAARGFDMFARMIVAGGFDRILLRPRGTILQVFGSAFEITRIGKAVQGMVMLALAASWIDTVWTTAKIITLILMIISGVFIFTGVFILGATVCFFTVQGLEFINIFTDGGREIASYPLNIYNKWLTRFFTFIIPFGCINYLPLMYITDRAREHPVLYMFTPLFGILFVVPCLLVWNMGVRRYASTGS